MKNSKIIWRILNRTGAIKLLYIYLIFFAGSAVAITFAEPAISSFFDGVWYCFSVMTTIGFGDYTAVTVLGRVVTIILSVYSILIVAIIPAVITSFYIEKIKMRTNESMEKFMYDLERLPELSKEELADLSQRVKEFQEKRKG